MSDAVRKSLSAGLTVCVLLRSAHAVVEHAVRDRRAGGVLKE
jgi:hypothetical protein